MCGRWIRKKHEEILEEAVVGVPGRDEGSWAWSGSSAGGEVAVQVVGMEGLRPTLVVELTRLKKRLDWVGVGGKGEKGIKNESQVSSLCNWLDVFLFTELETLQRKNLQGGNYWQSRTQFWTWYVWDVSEVGVQVGS